MKKIVAMVVAGSVLPLFAVPQHAAATREFARHGAKRLYHVAIGIDTTLPVLRVNTFVPSHLVIHAGDSVQWTNAVGAQPQTVTFGPVENTPSLITDPSASEINPRVVRPQGGHAIGDVSLDVYSSGALMRGIRGLGASYTFTFPRTGTYLYRSLFHPLDVATIDVVPANKPASSTTVDSGPIAADILRSVAQSLSDEQPRELDGGIAHGDTTVAVGIGANTVSINKFSPSGLTVPVSSTISWVVPETSGDLHALVFQPRLTDEAQGSLPLYTGLTKDGGLAINENYAQPSLVSGTKVTTDTLAGIQQATGSQRWTSGILYGSSVNYPSQVPNTYRLTFQVPGEYIYADPFHPGMQGTVNVTP